ncbi:MAG: hypothetical protein ACRD2R_01850, partial [Terriglobales bacterium]
VAQPTACAAAQAGGSCPLPAANAEAARKSFAAGLKLQQNGRTEEALEAFALATSRAPGNLDYVTVREMARQQAVTEALERGSARLREGQRVKAMAEFRGALELDPENQFARRQLQEAATRGADSPPTPVAAQPSGSPQPASRTMAIVEQSREVRVRPHPGRQDFHFRGGSRELIQEIGRAFGIRVAFDDSIVSKPVRFDVEGVEFATAMALACQLSHAFSVPLSEQEALVVSDTRDNRNRFERMTLRTFYLPDVTSAPEMNELVGALRAVFEVRLLSPQPAQSLLTVRAPQAQMDGITRFLEELVAGRPQVLLEVKVYEVSRTLLRNLGVELPLRFQIFNLPSEARSLVSTPGGQSLVDQLVATGGINQVDPALVAALLAQLSAQQASVLTQPFATFGGGITLTGVGIPPGVANAELTESDLRSLQHATLRAAHASTATFNVGTRFPILNATFAPILNSPQLTREIQNNTFQTAFPSFSYEDLGLTVKATPMVRGENEVMLQMEMKISALGGTGFNGLPILSNREYTGAATVKSGETTVLAGAVSQSEQRSMRGIPGAARVPMLGHATSSTRTEKTENQVLILVTPYIVRTAGRGVMVANP